MWPMMGWMFPGTMMFTGILLWVLVIAAAVLLLKWLLEKDRDIPVERDRESPLEALERRYAKGEVSRKEFKKIKKEILSSYGSKPKGGGKMEVSLCEKCGSCPRVMTVKGGMEIGEEGNSVRLKPGEWNLLVDKIRKGELNKL